MCKMTIVHSMPCLLPRLLWLWGCTIEPLHFYFHFKKNENQAWSISRKTGSDSWEPKGVMHISFLKTSVFSSPALQLLVSQALISFSSQKTWLCTEGGGSLTWSTDGHVMCSLVGYFLGPVWYCSYVSPCPCDTSGTHLVEHVWTCVSRVTTGHKLK